MSVQYQEPQTLPGYNTVSPYKGNSESIGNITGSSLEKAVELVVPKSHECHCTADSPCKKDGICRCMAGLQAKLAGVIK
jgi:hypothetical protein